MQVWAHNNFCSVCAWSIIFASIDKQATCFESTLIIQEEIYPSNHYLYSCKKWCELDSLFCCSLLGYLLSREPPPRGKLWATRARGCVRESRRAASSVENAGRAARLRCSARVARFTSVTSEGRHRLFLMSLLALQNVPQKMQIFKRHPKIWKTSVGGVRVKEDSYLRQKQQQPSKLWSARNRKWQKLFFQIIIRLLRKRER